LPSPPRTDRLVHRFVLASYLVAAVAFALALVRTFEGDLWIGLLGNVSAVSVGSGAVIYAVGQYTFEGAGSSEATSAVLGVLFANAFLQVYEVLYNLTFGLESLISDPIVISGTEVRMLLLWTLMILPAYLVLGSLRLKRSGIGVLALCALLWLVWILSGFPQYYPAPHTYRQFIPTGDRYELALWLNFGTKALLAAFFVSLLEPVGALRAALVTLRGGTPSQEGGLPARRRHPNSRI
jgi:hypothetical protein